MEKKRNWEQGEGLIQEMEEEMERMHIVVDLRILNKKSDGNRRKWFHRSLIPGTFYLPVDPKCSA
jgi:hypothetical protein